jgi:hypothetical protein
VLPTFVRPARRTLERGRRNPRKGTDACLALARDDVVSSDFLRHRRPCATIPATTTPSRELQCHPRGCGSTGRQDVATPAVVHLTPSRQPHPQVSVRTTTREEAPTPPPSKPLLDGYRARHDALPEARFARTAVNSTTLHTISLHVIRTVRHDCKLPPLGL